MMRPSPEGLFSLYAGSMFAAALAEEIGGAAEEEAEAEAEAGGVDTT